MVVTTISTDGDDYLVGSGSNVTVSGGAGNDTIGGNYSGNAYLNGDDGDDVIGGSFSSLDPNAFIRGSGGAGNDTIDPTYWGRFYDANGGTGDDVIYARSPFAYHVGGSGGETTGDVFDARFLSGPFTLRLMSTSIYQYFGDSGSFSFQYTFGFEIFRLRSVSDFLTAATSELGVRVEGMGGNDTLVGSDYADSLYGGDDLDTLQGSAGTDRLFGDAGDDSLAGGDDADTLDGGADADTLDGGDGSDVLNGGDGNDRIFGQTGDDVADGGGGNDSLSGGIGLDSLSGGEDADRLDGGEGDDTLDGGTGIDVLIGGAGADHLIGGDQIDTADYRTSTSAVALSLVTGGTGGDAAGDVFFGVENVIGSNHSDAITGDSVRNVLHGGLGDDTIHGGGGADAIFGGRGADMLDGGDGLDFAYYSQSRVGVYINLAYGFGFAGDADGDTLAGIEGVIGSRFNDILTGDWDTNYLYGESGNDRIDGGYGDDRLRGGSGADTLDGGAGNDFAYYTTSGSAVQIDLAFGHAAGGHAEGDVLWDIEHLVGSAWSDDLTGDECDNRLFGLDGDDNLSGLSGADSLVGGNGNDFLYGDKGNDRLIAGDGDDHLFGGSNADLLWGGAGRDVFVFTYDDSGVGSSALRDRIFDFNADDGDMIDLSGISGLTELSSGSAFSGTGPDMYSLQISGNTRLFVDVDGDTVTDMEIDLRGLYTLTSSNFVFD